MVVIRQVDEGFDEELSQAGELFYIEELVFNRIMEGFHVAVESGRGRRDTDVSYSVFSQGSLKYSSGMI